jgi:hypothetical protein
VSFLVHGIRPPQTTYGIINEALFFTARRIHNEIHC